jgi:hypothetical protein
VDAGNLISCGLSALALAVSVASYRRTGSRVSARYTVKKATADQKDIALFFRLTLVNVGLAPVQVVKIVQHMRMDPGSEILEFQHEVGHFEEGPALPFVLPASSSQEWVAMVEDIHDGPVRNGLGSVLEILPRRSCLIVSLGNGRRVKAHRRSFFLMLEFYFAKKPWRVARAAISAAGETLRRVVKQ